MVRITNIFLSALFAFSFSAICFQINLGGFFFFSSLVSSYFISYFLLRYIRPKGYADELINENEELQTRIEELESENNNYKLEIMKLENKIEYQSEVMELTKNFTKSSVN
jgi:hypothetical protein